MVDLSIVLPTYNERENIKMLIPELEEFLVKYRLSAEIIVVDDNSPDGTAQAVAKINKKYGNIKVIIKKKKEGIGAALRVGYDAAKGKMILSSDSDMSFDVHDMTKLINKVKEGYDLVVGSRHMSRGSYVKNTFGVKIKGFVSYFGNIIVRILTGVNIHDFSANFRIIKKNVWREIETQENTNSLLLEMILKVKYKGYKIAEVPVIFRERLYGKSKLNLVKEAPKFFLKLIFYSIKFRRVG